MLLTVLIIGGSVAIMYPPSLNGNCLNAAHFKLQNIDMLTCTPANIHVKASDVHVENAVTTYQFLSEC